jgi:hypothetical protein
VPKTPELNIEGMTGTVAEVVKFYKVRMEGEEKNKTLSIARPSLPRPSTSPLLPTTLPIRNHPTPHHPQGVELSATQPYRVQLDMPEPADGKKAPKVFVHLVRCLFSFAWGWRERRGFFVQRQWCPLNHAHHSLTFPPQKSQHLSLPPSLSSHTGRRRDRHRVDLRGAMGGKHGACVLFFFVVGGGCVEDKNAKKKKKSFSSLFSYNKSLPAPLHTRRRRRARRPPRLPQHPARPHHPRRLH